MSRKRALVAMVALCALSVARPHGQPASTLPTGQMWAATWSASVHGPYPSGNRFRIRLSNTFGAQPVTFDAVFMGVQASGGSLVTGTNRPVTFGGQRTVTISPGSSAYSDGVELSLPSVTACRRAFASGVPALPFAVRADVID